jgi:hypothetical protein
MAAKHSIGWFELYVNDFEKSKKFYSDLFGWKFNESLSMGVPYWNIFTGEGSLSGGLMKKTAPEHSGQAVVLYVETDDLEATLNKVVSLGGTVETGKTRISESSGYFGLFKDIDGNVVGLWSKS